MVGRAGCLPPADRAQLRAGNLTNHPGTPAGQPLPPRVQWRAVRWLVSSEQRLSAWFVVLADAGIGADPPGVIQGRGRSAQRVAFAAAAPRAVAAARLPPFAR